MVPTSVPQTQMFDITWRIWAFKNPIWLNCVQCLPFLSNFDCPPIIRPALSVAACLACLRHCPQNACFSRKSTLCVSRVKFFWSQFFFKAEATSKSNSVYSVRRLHTEDSFSKNWLPLPPLVPYPQPTRSCGQCIVFYSCIFCIFVFPVSFIPPSPISPMAGPFGCVASAPKKISIT